MNKTSFTFKKSERLKKRKYIEALFENGKVLSHFPFKCIYSLEKFDADKHSTYTQFGISIPKRKVRTAVKRNLLKRRARESWRLLKPDLSICLSEKKLVLKIFFIYKSSQIESFAVIKNAFDRIIPKLVSGINNSGSAYV